MIGGIRSGGSAIISFVKAAAPNLCQSAIFFACGLSGPKDL